MVYKRVIPVVLIHNFKVIQSFQFSNYKNLGNPIQTVKRLSEWDSDEIIVLQVSPGNSQIKDRLDTNTRNLGNIMQQISSFAQVPITLGGGIRSLNQIEQIISAGADKVALNYVSLFDKKLFSQAVNEFGSQCIVASLDLKRNENAYSLFYHGQIQSDFSVKDTLRELEFLGAGEFLLQSVDSDGMKLGYDIQLVSEFAPLCNIPLIILGGVGSWEHFVPLVENPLVDAVAAANIFQHFDQSVFLARQYLYTRGLPVRVPGLGS